MSRVAKIKYDTLGAMARNSNPDRNNDTADGAHLVRPSRSELGPKDKLLAPQRPGWVRRWVNDVPGRIEELLRMGYRIVTGNIKTADDAAANDSPMGSSMNRAVGGGIRGVLMETPIELYRHGKREKEESRRGLEADLLLPGKDRKAVDGVQSYGTVTKDKL